MSANAYAQRYLDLLERLKAFAPIAGMVHNANHRDALAKIIEMPIHDLIELWASLAVMQALCEAAGTAMEGPVSLRMVAAGMTEEQARAFAERLRLTE